MTSRLDWGTWRGLEANVEKRRAQARAEHHAPLYTLAELAVDLGVDHGALKAVVSRGGIEPVFRHGSNRTANPRRYYRRREVFAVWAAHVAKGSSK